MIYVNGDDPLDDTLVAADGASNETAKSPNYNSNSVASTSSSSRHKQTDAHKSLDLFWPNVLEDVKKIKTVDAKNQNLPLARIKKIMKLDENAKMIAAEAPLLFAKACEIFIQELTLRAWIHTEDNKRRTLQRSDIATAISRYDQFDFLIDIVPREDIKPRKESETATVTATATARSATAPTEQVQYYLQLAQQHQQTAVQNSQQNAAAAIVNQTIPVATGSGSVANVTVAAAGHQNILLTTATNPTQQTNATTTVQPTLVNNLQVPQQQQIQLLQQIVTPTGEITHIPITINANQLNLLRMQLQGNNANVSQQLQQMIIPTIQTHQQQPSILQVSTGGQNALASGGSIFLNTGHPHVSVSTTGTTIVDTMTRNTANNFRGNC